MFTYVRKQQSSKVFLPFYTPIAMSEFMYSIFSSAFEVRVLHFSNSRRYEKVSHFNLRFSHYMWCVNIVHMFICHMCIFGEVSVQILCPLSNWVACFLTVEFWGVLVYCGDKLCISVLQIHSPSLWVCLSQRKNY